MSGSSVPAVVSYLWDLAEANKPAGAEVIYGEPVDSPTGLFLALPWSGDPDTSAISLTDKSADVGDRQRRESYDIHAEISNWGGDIDEPDARAYASAILASVYAFHEALYAAIAGDRKLGGLVDKATVTAGEYTPSSSEGAVGTLRFLIHVEAWRTA